MANMKKSELAQYDLDEKFTNVIDNLLEENGKGEGEEL